MTKRSQGLFEVVSDVDSINTTTTAASDLNDDGEYAVEKILAEEMGDHGKMMYLLKWESYPLHRCTWESRENITSALLIRDWDRGKIAVRNGEKQPFDVNVFNLAVEQWMEDVEDKKRRRTAKRRKRGELVQSPEDALMSDSEDELAKPKSPKRSRAKNLPVQRKGVAKSVTKRARRPSRLDEDESSTEKESEDDGLELVASRSKAHTAGNRTAARSTSETALVTSKTKLPEIRPPQKKAVSSSEKATKPSVPTKANPVHVPNAQTAANEPGVTSSKAVSAIAARKSVPATASKSAPQKRSGISNVFTSEWATEKKARQRKQVSGDTPKDSVDPQFTHLAIQNRYQKYSKNEPPPDPNALNFVDPKTGIAQPATNASTKVGPTEIHSAYGRGRTPPPTAKQRSASPPRPPVPQPPPPTRQVTFSNNVESSTSPIEPSKTATPHTKQFICKFWQTGSCRHTPDTCLFTHSYITPTVPSNSGPTKKLTTCYYWANDGFCKYSAEDCAFAHYDTGFYAGPPGSYRKDSIAPKTLDVKSPDLRLVTNSSSPSETFFDAPEQLPQQPKSAPARENAVFFTETTSGNTADVVMTDQSELVKSLTIESPTANGLVTNMTDPRLAGRTSTTNQTMISAAKDPRLRPLDTKTNGQIPGLPAMAKSDHFIHGSLEADLEMAIRTIPNLEWSSLTKVDKKDPIENVYIHMPPERAAESHLLETLFKELHCKVFTSRAQIDQWRYFRKTFDKNYHKPCLIIFHPSEMFINTIRGLQGYLTEKGAGLRVFSIGVQHSLSIREQREPRYQEQRLFPHGAFTFISDDVFVYYPEKATEIIEKFLKDANERPPGTQLNKIGARPDIKDWIVRLATQKYCEQGGQGKSTDMRWVQCYEALCNLCPMEDEDLDYPSNSVPQESSYLWSVWEESLPSFKGRWESGDEEGATDYMINHFAGEACAMAWKYRKFLFVYQRPGMESVTTDSQGQEVVKQDTDPKGWMRKYCHVGVVTPDQALKSMRGKK